MTTATHASSAKRRLSPRYRLRLNKPLLIVIEVLVPISLFVIWWLVSANSKNIFFPPLADIVSKFQELWLFQHFSSDILPSLGNLLAGFLLGGITGVILGVSLGMVSILNWLFNPVIDFFRAIPPVALVPIFVTLLGFDNDVRILTIMIASVFPTLVSTIDGMRALDPQLRDVSNVYGFTKRQKLFNVYLPAAGPRIASGLQVSLQVAFVVMIASEMLGSSSGIGALTLMAQQTFATPDMWSGIILLGILGYLVNLVFNIVRDRMLQWYVQSQRAGKEM